MKNWINICFICTSLILFSSFSDHPSRGEGTQAINTEEKIAGVSLVSPPNPVTDSWTQSVQQIDAEWVAILPYGFSYAGSPEVIYNTRRQWWGERIEGMTQLIRHAHKNDLKIMLKPMVWIMGSWPGGYDLKSEADWKIWESTYSKYILETARIAEAEGVEMFCIGTEFKVASNNREQFWRSLAKEVRKVYSGPITYAANWDEYTGVRFWDAMDYIGLDAYFPLVDQTTPSPTQMIKEWQPTAKKLKTLSTLYSRPILFTEFGYRSIDNCAWQQWELESIPYTQQINMEGQKNAYEAFFRTFWSQDWFAGMFLWQWYTNDAKAGGPKNSDYTPQNKPAESRIKEWFQK